MKIIQNKIISFLLIICSIFVLTGCGGASKNNNQNNENQTSQEQIGGYDNLDNVLYIHINERVLTANLVDNSSTRALVELLSDDNITINMSDYANFEKVGSLGTSLPRNDEPIRTEAGDLILYQGNQFVIYYDTNSWTFTRLGKIQNITQSELMSILGEGDVSITLSLEN